MPACTTTRRHAERSSDKEPSDRPGAWGQRSLVDRDVLAPRLLALTEAIQHIEREYPGDAPSLAAKPVIRAAIERWLQVAIEACIDIAYHVIAERGWAPPDRARDAFPILASHGELDAQFASRLARAVGLRNVLVHEYVAVDLERIARGVREDLADLKAFATVVARWLEEP